jgi:hypothetical protein
MRGIAICLSLFASQIVAIGVGRADATLTAERQRRNDALVHEGFNLTHGLGFDAAGTRMELWVPPGEPGAPPHQIALWFASDDGRADERVRFVAADGALLASWQAPRGEQRLERTLAPGRYVIEVSGAAGQGLVGVKGPSIPACALPSRVRERPARPQAGYHWPYLLATPSAGHDAHTLLVLPNNTGFASDDVALLRASASCDLQRAHAMADRLGVTLLEPLFPRPTTHDEAEDLYLQALSRAALTTTRPDVARVDLQLAAMIDDARAQLGPATRRRVLIAGFSAAGSFANRWAMLHPERVLASVAGSPGGWPIAPPTEPALTYPVGVADVAMLTGAPIDRKALRDVDFFVYIGGDDGNDAVPSRDSFSAADEQLVMSRFGKTPVARWPAAERLYEQARLRARFQVYPGVAHSIAPEMERDIEAVLAAAIKR